MLSVVLRRLRSCVMSLDVVWIFLMLLIVVCEFLICCLILMRF